LRQTESLTTEDTEYTEEEVSSIQMEFIGHFRRLTPVQRNTFIACFLGWTLDAFDFFILIFCVSALATQFQTKVSVITEAIF